MKKIFAVFSFLFLFTLLLSGCEKEHEHSWVDADCVSPKHCEICGLTIGEAIGHDWIDATCSSAKSCSRCGITEGKALGHTWAEATCTEPKTCTVCNQSEGLPLGHDISGQSCAAESTCKRCGKTLAALDHEWKNATCSTPKTCARCGQTEGSALGHTWTEATCTTPQTCSRCGETNGSALGHSWTEATCSAPQTCSRCSVTEGSALGHSFKDGKCERCGEADPNYVPPQTYENNLCYDLVEEGSHKDSLGNTIIIHKVLAKKDCTVEATILAIDAAGNVLGKSTDNIVLTEGKYNYFKFTFKADISHATLQASVSEQNDSILTGNRNDYVELVQYNKTGDYLYLTFKQAGEKVEYFAKFKLLFYKNNKIVDSDQGYFSSYAKNLTGKNSVDVAEFWAYKIDFDRIEYIFEP